MKRNYQKLNKELSFKYEVAVPVKPRQLLKENLLNLFRKSFTLKCQIQMYIVSKEGDDIFCYCKKSEGALCHHEFALCISLLKDSDILYNQPCWKILYHDIKNDSTYSERQEEEKHEEEKK